MGDDSNVSLSVRYFFLKLEKQYIIKFKQMLTKMFIEN